MILKFVFDGGKVMISPKQGSRIDIFKWSDIGCKKEIVKVFNLKESDEKIAKVNPYICYIDNEPHVIQSLGSSLFIMNEQTGQTIDKLW